MTPNGRTWTLAACYRAQWFAIALIASDRVLLVRRYQLPSLKAGQVRIREIIDRYSTDYAPTDIVLEDTIAMRSLGRGLAANIAFGSIVGAKRLLAPTAERATHEHLYHQLLKAHPKLQRLVTVLPGTKRIAMSERARTVQLLSVALGLAAAADGQPLPSNHNNLTKLSP